MTDINELIARSNEITRSAIVNAAAWAKQSGKSKEAIIEERDVWLAELGAIPQWKTLIEESYNNIL